LPEDGKLVGWESLTNTAAIDFYMDCLFSLKHSQYSCTRGDINIFSKSHIAKKVQSLLKNFFKVKIYTNLDYFTSSQNMK